MVIRFSIHVRFKFFRLIILNILETICHMPLQRSLARQVAKLKQPVHEYKSKHIQCSGSNRLAR